MLWTTDEETGSHTSRALIEAEARKSEAVLVLEPALAGGALKTGRKGIGQYEVAVHGVSAHAGVDPRKGVNAIRELAQQVLALDSLRDLDRGISLNVGLISGGSRPNVVPDLAIEIVSPSNSAEEIMIRLDEYFRAGTRLVWVVYPGTSKVYAYDSPTAVRILQAGDDLDGGAVLPGFRLPLAALFEDGPAPDAGAEGQAGE